MLFQYLCIYYFTSYVNIVFNFMVVSLHMKVVIALWLVNQCSAMINSTRSKWLLEEHGHIKAEMTQELETLDISFGWPNIFQLVKDMCVFCETFWLQSDV